MSRRVIVDLEKITKYRAGDMFEGCTVIWVDDLKACPEALDDKEYKAELKKRIEKERLPIHSTFGIAYSTYEFRTDIIDIIDNMPPRIEVKDGKE